MNLDWEDMTSAELFAELARLHKELAEYYQERAQGVVRNLRGWSPRDNEYEIGAIESELESRGD